MRSCTVSLLEKIRAHRLSGTTTASDRIRKHENFVQVDFGGCSLPEVLALCAEFAGLCVTTRMRCALLKGGDEDMRRCLAVRDLLKILMLVVPRDFRLALVPGTPRTAAVSGVMGKPW